MFGSNKVANYIGTGFLAAVALLQILLLGGISPADAAYYCQCVDYVKQVSGIPSNVAVGDAKDMGNYLPGLGFGRVNAQVGSIAVMQPSFPGADRTYGHTAKVIATRQVGGRSYVTLRGANQGGSGNDANCSNVNDWTVNTAVDGRNDIVFFARGGNNNPPASNDTSIRTVNFTGTTSNNRTNVRTAPSTSASSPGSLNPNTRLNFNAWTYGTPVNDLWTGKSDRRWYRFTMGGISYWIASATVNGNAPGSTP